MSARRRTPTSGASIASAAPVGGYEFNFNEKEWQAQVVEVARVVGWNRIYHTHNSRRSASGYPDLTLVRDRLVFLELKRAGGKLSPAQAAWIRALLHAACEVYVVRPADLDALATVLAYRGDPFQARGPVVDVAARLREATRVEAEAL